MYLNGLEKQNASVSTIINYANPNFGIAGVGQTISELIFYNYDMMSYDFERSAQDQLATLKYQVDIQCSTTSQFYNPEAGTC